jgi:hypothetical protein
MSKDSWLFFFAALSALFPVLQFVVPFFGGGWFHSVKPMNWMIIGLLGCMIFSGWGFYRSLNRVVAYDDSAPLELVHGKIFVNKEVQVDGKQFTKCTFENVTFAYNGERNFSIINCTFKGSQILRPVGGGLRGLVALQIGIGLLPESTRYVGDILEHVQRPTTRPSSTPDKGASPP